MELVSRYKVFLPKASLQNIQIYVGIYSYALLQIFLQYSNLLSRRTCFLKVLTNINGSSSPLLCTARSRIYLPIALGLPIKLRAATETSNC
ncbi:hypothetical protein M758_UG202700 [Ceratodon purpureus]|nr:hypothetical protein M758_UG202700 [Ceratodon purpureus]